MGSQHENWHQLLWMMSRMFLFHALIGNIALAKSGEELGCLFPVNLDGYIKVNKTQAVDFKKKKKTVQ